jgi:hypothetical protein
MSCAGAGDRGSTVPGAGRPVIDDDGDIERLDHVGPAPKLIEESIHGHMELDVPAHRAKCRLPGADGRRREAAWIDQIAADPTDAAFVHRFEVPRGRVRGRYGDAPQTPTRACERVEKAPVIVTVHTRLHEDTARDAVLVEQREVVVERRDRGRVASSRPERVLAWVADYVRVRVPRDRVRPG